jgi:hypothetical protein
MLADVAQCRGTEQRIGQGMQQYISIGMRQQAEFVRNPHATERDEVALAEAVDVVTMADTHAHNPFEKLKVAILQERRAVVIPAPRIDHGDEHYRPNRSHIAF